MDVTNSAEEMLQAAQAVLALPRQVNRAGRDCVIEHYNWDTNLRRMDSFLLSEGAAA